jgi:hypothetical protein
MTAEASTPVQRPAPRSATPVPGTTVKLSLEDDGFAAELAGYEPPGHAPDERDV